MEGHHAIIDALRKRDAREAARLMGDHIRRSGELAQEFAEHRAGLVADGTAAG